MAKEELNIILGEIVDEETWFDLYQLCHTTGINAEYVIEFVECGLIEPEGEEPVEWRFDFVSVQRLRRAVRLQRDLQVNIDALPLVLDLLDELQTLRRKLANTP